MKNGIPAPAGRKYGFPPESGKEPLWLLLGSLPGDESIRQASYYAHPRNAFWRIVGEIFGFSPLLPYPERVAELIAARVALWDSARAARRPGSLDAALREVEPNDVPAFLASHPTIRKIGCNGSASRTLLKRFHPELFDRFPVIQLPSTSPAAATFTYFQKFQAYQKFFE